MNKKRTLVYLSSVIASMLLTACVSDTYLKTYRQKNTECTDREYQRLKDVKLINYKACELQADRLARQAEQANGDKSIFDVLLPVAGAAAGVYAGNQEAKSNSRNRNTTSSQSGSQASTQTSRNSYPTSDSSNGSYSLSDSSASNTSERRPDNPAALVNQCISIKPGGGGLKNNCGFTVYYTYCTLYGIHNMVNKCEQNRLGSSGMGAYKDDGYSSLQGEKINWFACRAPSMPKQTNYDPQQGVITGYCSN